MDQGDKQDKLYGILKRVKECPHLYLNKKSITQLDLLIRGFFLAANEEYLYWNCLSGFDEYCAASLNHELGALNWYHIIMDCVSEEKAWDTFFNLFEAFVEKRKQQGKPFGPPPHFVLGGIYRYKKKNQIYFAIPLCYIKGIYLVAVTKSEANQVETIDEHIKTKKQMVRIAWIPIMQMITPRESLKIGDITLCGNYEIILGRQIDAGSTHLNNLAGYSIWEMKERTEFSAISIETLANADDLQRLYLSNPK